MSPLTRSLTRSLTLCLTLTLSLGLAPLSAQAQESPIEDHAAWRASATECAELLLNLSGRPHASLTPEACAERLMRAVSEVRDYGDWPRMELELLRLRHEILTLPYVTHPRELKALWEEVALVPSSGELLSAVKAEVCEELKRLYDAEQGASSAALEALLSESEAGRAPLVKRDALCSDTGDVADLLYKHLSDLQEHLSEQSSYEKSERLLLKLIPVHRGNYDPEDTRIAEEVHTVSVRLKGKRRAEARRRAARWVSEASERLKALPAPQRLSYELAVKQRSEDWEVGPLVALDPGVSVSRGELIIDASEEYEGDYGRRETGFRITAPPGPLRGTLALRAPLWFIFNGDYTCEVSLSAEVINALRWRTFQRRKLTCVSDLFGRRRKITYRLE
jgi:hypothetical protein